MKPADLPASIKKLGLDPLHARGQNFLIDQHVLEDISAAADLRPGDNVLEIGPGPGVLTERLVAAGGRVVAVEIDRRFQALLAGRFPERFTLVIGDIRDFTTRQLADFFGDGTDDYKVVANIPYAVTSAIITKFLEEPPRPRTMILMVQREVADRLLARPGEMSQLAVFTQTYAKISRVTNVSRNSFWPPPKVNSAVIRLEVRGQAEIDGYFGDVDPKSYFSLVKSCFVQKRKKIRNTLPFPSEVNDRLLIEAHIPADARPQGLGIDDWRHLAEVAGDVKGG